MMKNPDKITYRIKNEKIIFCKDNVYFAIVKDDLLELSEIVTFLLNSELNPSLIRQDEDKALEWIKTTTTKELLPVNYKWIMVKAMKEIIERLEKVENDRKSN